MERDQYAGAGTVLVVAEGIDSAEIAVKISPRSFSQLLPHKKNKINIRSMEMNAIRKAFGISAAVRLPFFRKDVYWQGSFSTTSESIDISTGALTVNLTFISSNAEIVQG